MERRQGLRRAARRRRSAPQRLHHSVHRVRRHQLLESSVPRVDEPAATGSSYSDVVLVQEIIALCEHAV